MDQETALPALAVLHLGLGGLWVAQYPVMRMEAAHCGSASLKR